MVSEAEDVELFEIDAAAQEFVASPAGEQAEIEAFSFLESINNIALVLVNQIVAHFDRIKNAQARQAVTSLFDIDPIEARGFLEPDPMLEGGEFGFVIILEFDLVEGYPGTGEDSGQEVEVDDGTGSGDVGADDID